MLSSENYLSNAVVSKFKPYPDAEVFGEDLEALQGGMDTLRKGIITNKIVVRL
ncbi:hypothetical protein F5X99DRAFT_386464 [Biscogniauxia marginata]|nr:hypothetical protein F5X99DRAFT_386464 [Biscogniauxia marginata]